MDKLAPARLCAAVRHDYRILSFPIEDEHTFIRKRFTRVLIPFVIWCAVYAFYYYAQGAITLQIALLNIAKIPVN